LITRTARTRASYPSCVAVYPRDSQSRRVLCLASRSLGEGGSLFPFAPLLGREKRAKIGFMGHNKGRDNAKKRAKRRKKYERLASAKQPSRDATARQGKKASK